MLLEKLDISFLLGVFTSSIIVWIFLFNRIVSISTEEPTSRSLINLGVSHFISFLCVLFSFIILMGHGIELGMEKAEFQKLEKFNRVIDFSYKALSSLWGPMLIFSLATLLTQNLFSSPKYRSLYSIGTLGVSIVLCLVVFNLFFKINFFSLLSALHWTFYALSPVYFILHVIVVSYYAADIKFSIEKEFYKDDEIVRFRVTRKGYILLPEIAKVNYNRQKILTEYSDETYFINLAEFAGEKISLLEIEYQPQVFPTHHYRYFHISKTPKEA